MVMKQLLVSGETHRGLIDALVDLEIRLIIDKQPTAEVKRLLGVIKNAPNVKVVK